MDTALRKDIYDQLVPVWSGCFSRDFTAESIVPDAMPDMASVVDADSVITLRSKETETGCLTLGASVSVSVLYTPENGGPLQSLAVVIPVEMRTDAPGADGDCRTVARLRVRALDARMVNSRKLSVRVDVDCEACVYQRKCVELPSGLAEENKCVHVLTRTAPMVTVADVREKTFVITDGYQLPTGSAGVERILSQRVDAAVEDVKFVPGKVIFRGKVRSGLIFACRDGQIFAGRYETEFSQIMEVEPQEGDVTPEVALMFTGAYFDLPERQDEDGRVAAELHLAAQATCRVTGEASYIADLYSNRTCLEPCREQIPLSCAVKSLSMRQSVTGSAELMGAAGDVLCLSATVGTTAVEGNTVKANLNVRAILRQEDGGYTCVRCRLAAEFTTDISPDAELQGICVTAADVFCAPAGASLDVRATLQMEATAVTKTAIAAVTAVEEDPDAWAAMPPAPSITLVRVEPGADMWALARKYRSTVEAIAAANAGKETGLLLIPKAR